MSIAVKKNTAYGVEIEVTEGTPVAPSSASKFVQVLTDGSEVKGSKELLDRNIFTSSIGKTSPRVGQTDAGATLATEARASSTEGSAPEINPLMMSAMGNKRTISTTTTTKASGNTATVLQIEDADISKFTVGDIVMTKGSGAFHVSPIASKTSGAGTATITLLAPHPSGDHADSVVVSKSTTYIPADSGHASLTISKYIEGTVLEQVRGAKVTSLSLENFSTGQLPSLKFELGALGLSKSVSAIPYTPSYDSSLPPIVLDARLYMDATAIDVNEISFQLDNALGFETSIAATNGRVASRATERSIKGSFNPYKQDNSVANWTKFEANTAFSLFAYAKVPTATPGEFGQVVAVYMPNCIITEVAEADADGLLQENISFSANRGTTGAIPEIYIAFI